MEGICALLLQGGARLRALLPTISGGHSLASSTYAMAEGGGDRTFARMEQARQVAIASYQVDQKDQSQELASKATSAKDGHANC